MEIKLSPLGYDRWARIESRLYFYMRYGRDPWIRQLFEEEWRRWLED